MRRNFILCFMLIGTLLWASTAVASGPEDAQKQLQASVTRILNYIKSPGYKNASMRKSINASIEKEVYAIFDFNEFSMRTVGAFWKNFTPEQKNAFNNAFAELLFATYLDRIDGYNGESVTYDGFVSGNNGKRVEVRTTVTVKGTQKVPLNYRMLPKNGQWRVYDVLVEGVSLVKNYRTQFNDALQSGSPEALIARVRERSAAIKGTSYGN